MCGVAGYVGPGSPAWEPHLREAIRYRGRDGEGAWGNNGEVRLLHARLSIIDHATGDQPMHDRSGRFTIVFNGEIYNYRELRIQYEAAGAVFRTRSDTEVILEGFRLKGSAVCSDLNGMFAFAIWDTVAHRLFVARDRLGKKPFYWTRIGEVFVFSSTIDSFSGIPGWDDTLSRVNIDFYSAVGTFPVGYTAFRKAFSLPPASFAWIGPKSLTPAPESYWRHRFGGKSKLDADSAIEELEPLLLDAIEIRLRADVPCCLTFSGGVDSGLIAALAARRLGQRLQCWTLDYHTPEDPSDEAIIAERTAALLGLEWRFINFDYHAELFPALRRALEHVDQPCNQIAISYSRRLYEGIVGEAKVVLTGNGADELFLGYSGNESLLSQDRERDAAGDRLLARLLPRRLADALGISRFAKLADYQTAYVAANLSSHAGEPEPEALIEDLRRDILEAGIDSHADLYTWMSLRFYTCDANFRLPDIAGLSAQVEVRSPFLDHRVIEFAGRCPSELKLGRVDGTENKLLLKKYYERFVPHETAWAPKKGMGGNLRYDNSIATDERLHIFYEELMKGLEQVGIAAGRYRRAMYSYIADKTAGTRYPSSAGIMMAGLMLGMWLERHQRLRAAP